MKKFNIVYLIMIVSTLVISNGCSQNRLAWNMTNVSSIYIDAPETVINANYGRESVTTIVQKAGNFRVVNSQEQADATLKIEIIDISPTFSWTNSEGRIVRSRVLIFSYDLMRNSDGEILGRGTNLRRFVPDHDNAGSLIIMHLEYRLPQLMK